MFRSVWEMLLIQGSPPTKKVLDTGSNPKTERLPYDWGLNSKENAR